MTTVRNWIYTRLSTGATTALVGDRIFPPNAFGSTDVQVARPFIIVSQGLSTTEWGVSTRAYQLWAHDDQGGMDRIDSILLALRTDLDGLTSIKLTGGAFIYSCAWEGDSSDLYDDALRTGAKFSSFRVVARA